MFNSHKIKSRKEHHPTVDQHMENGMEGHTHRQVIHT